MTGEIFLQHGVLTNFIYPFLLMFFILFAVLEKTKVLGENQKQVNALVSFVISLIFVSAIFPKMVVGNLILFLTVSIVIVFVALLLWGFVSGDKDFKPNSTLKTTLMVIVGIGVVVAIFWAMGIAGGVFDFLFKQSWSSTFWTNFLFIVVIAVALALVIKAKK